MVNFPQNPFKRKTAGVTYLGTCFERLHNEHLTAVFLTLFHLPLTQDLDSYKTNISKIKFPLKNAIMSFCY